MVANTTGRLVALVYERNKSVVPMNASINQVSTLTRRASINCGWQCVDRKMVVKMLAIADDFDYTIGD
jgi:hypothetical protein